MQIYLACTVFLLFITFCRILLQPPPHLPNVFNFMKLVCLTLGNFLNYYLCTDSCIVTLSEFSTLKKDIEWYHLYSFFFFFASQDDLERCISCCFIWWYLSTLDESMKIYFSGYWYLKDCFLNFYKQCFSKIFVVISLCT